jgi:hypothetical protein
MRSRFRRLIGAVEAASGVAPAFIVSEHQED